MITLCATPGCGERIEHDGYEWTHSGSLYYGCDAHKNGKPSKTDVWTRLATPGVSYVEDATE